MVKPEPLKGKMITLKQLKEDVWEGIPHQVWDKLRNRKYCDEIKLKSAIEWLKQEDKKIYKDIAKLIKGIHSGIFSKVVAKFIELDLNKNKAFGNVAKVIKNEKGT